LAAKYIIENFSKNNKLKVKTQIFNFYHDDKNYKAKNIIAFKNNQADSSIIITAHYDHIGYGGELSQSKGINAIHYGADDNASGVGLLLELANYYSENAYKYNFYFVALSAHEIGLYGSKYFINKFPKKNKIKAIINFDMIGRLDNTQKLYYEATPELNKIISNQIDSISYLKLYKSPNARLEILDTKNFIVHNIPCITFSTGIHADYHKTSDKSQYINYNGLLLIEKFVINFIQLIEY